MQLEELESYFRSRLPLMLWGPPGVGKSARIRQLAQTLGTHLIELRLAQLSAPDLRGSARIEAGHTRWYPPACLPGPNASAEGILLLDELTTATPGVRVAAYQLILNRRLGEYRLPTGWWVCAAGQHPSDCAAASEIPVPLLNHFVHRRIEPDLEQWTTWALHAQIDPRIVGFLHFKPDFLYAPPPNGNPGRQEPGFPTPRSWAFVNSLLQVELLRVDNLAGAVGQAAAEAFSAYLTLSRNLPNLDEILRQPELASLPERSLGYTVVVALIARGKGYEAAIATYLLRLRDRDQILLGLSLALASLPELLTMECVVTFLVANQEALLVAREQPDEGVKPVSRLERPLAAPGLTPPDDL